MFRDRPELSRRALLAGLLAGVASPGFARAPSHSPRPPARPAFDQLAVLPPEPRAPRAPTSPLGELLARSGVSGETSIIAMDAETGAVIEEHRADLRVPPASTAKALTTMYALHHLGSEYRFITRVESSAALDGGTLRGDLVLRGGGDPTLQTAQLAELADQLIRRGLRRIEGRFIVDASVLPEIDEIDEGQPVAAGYNPAVGGLNLNFNRVHFGWEVTNGRAALTLDARSDREVPAVAVIDIEAVPRDIPVYTHDLRGDRERWTVAASALVQPGSRWLPVRRPGAYAADVFRALLAVRGCSLPEPRFSSVAPGPVLAESRSGSLPGVLREMLRYSTNITAEASGLMASLRQGSDPRSLGGSARRMNAWLQSRYGAEGMALVDHSGLGEESRVSSRGMAQFFRAARSEGILPGLLRDHPMRDASGRPVAGHPISVQAKTGTLNFVSSLAGYAQPRGGRMVVFSIISADMRRRRAIADDTSERPDGVRDWTARARNLQQDLIERWSALSG